MQENETPRVLFVSKPMSPPFRDGSKCLVRDLCLNLTEFQPHIMSTKAGADVLNHKAKLHAVYGDSGQFSPGLGQNLRAFSWLLRSPRVEIWHSIFAPNPRASLALRSLARVRRRLVCQTIASPPREFTHPERLLFGDIVVVQSAWTKTRFLDAYATGAALPPHIVEIPPPCPELTIPESSRVQSTRFELGLEAHDPLFVYPGDIEVSSAAAFLLNWAKHLRAHIPRGKLVIAYRNKSAGTRAAVEVLKDQVDPGVVLFRENVSDIVSLLRAAQAVLFPVDDLYGKVDLPIVLLEAMKVGTPVFALDSGPLQSLKGATLLEDSQETWLKAAIDLVHKPSLREQLVEQGKQAITNIYNAQVVARAYEEVYRELLSGRLSTKNNSK